MVPGLSVLRVSLTPAVLGIFKYIQIDLHLWPPGVEFSDDIYGSSEAAFQAAKAPRANKRLFQKLERGCAVETQTTVIKRMRTRPI